MYDIIIIGAGSGGLNCASFFNTIGLKVLLIDKTDHNIGGDCLNYGCIPSKALLHAAKAMHHSESAKKYGVAAGKSADFAKVMKSVKEKQEQIRQHENAEHLRRKGIDVELGYATFAGKRTVMVKNKTYKAKTIIIATGSRPRQLGIKGVEDIGLLTNETVFSLERLPKRFLVIGGGPIGIEMAQAFSRLGSSVTVIHTGSQILNKEDPAVAELLLERLKREGIEFILEAKPLEFAGKKILFYEDSKGRERKIHFDKALAAIGRDLNVDALEAENAGIRFTEDGKLVLDKYFRTTNKDIYALGDAAGSYLFTHVAELHARQIIRNILAPRPFMKAVDESGISWVTYTDPEIATFGLREQDLAERKMHYIRKEISSADEDRAITDEGQFGKLIVFLDRKRRLLGGTMIAKDAGELVQELLLLRTMNKPITALFEKTYPYPTASRINRSLALMVMNGSLTGRKKSLMRALFRTGR